uniref:Uncharacterized protein n=1 Tax=Acanthochromis polyacanthus TaxID=80966 RepID=A0A3Q1F3C5_9TELE
MKRNGSRSCVTRKTRFGSRERDWLKGDTQRGCVCLYGGTASSTPQTDLQLVLCSTNTTVEELCAQRDGQGLYVQLHGDLLCLHWIYSVQYCCALGCIWQLTHKMKLWLCEYIVSER